MKETPLGVLRRVRKARQGVDAAPLALVAVCAALVAALASDFVYAPGMYVGFDGKPSAALSRTLEPPKVTTTEMARTGLTVTLVSTRGTGVYVVAGRVVDSTSLGAELLRVAAAGGSSRPVLIKADGALMMRDFMAVCSAARAAGFPGVLIAANDPPPEDRPR